MDEAGGPPEAGPGGTTALWALPGSGRPPGGCQAQRSAGRRSSDPSPQVALTAQAVGPGGTGGRGRGQGAQGALPAAPPAPARRGRAAAVED